MKPSSTGSLRIIGGRWRGRKIRFPVNPGLRPTPNRVREALFNWLRDDITNARCVDLFAGSGALTFEALSRDAQAVTVVDKSALAIAAIRGELEPLPLADDQQVVLHQSTVEDWLRSESWAEPFDIAFLDPPFQGYDASAVLQGLRHSGALAARSLIYLESAAPLGVDLATGYRLFKQSRAGNVHFCLLQPETEARPP